MFMGIVEGTGGVAAVEAAAGTRRLEVELGELAGEAKVGDSIAIDGVCLTIAARRDTAATFDVMVETVRKTTLGSLAVGEVVNIEHSLRAGQSIDGHFVQGHVQGVGEIVQRVADEKDFKLTIKPPPELMKYIAPLGSIAVSGVSLTVAELAADTFTVALIPTTLKLTNLGDLREGDAVNIETDMVARQVVRYLELKGT
jgi:riboflavin synthase